MPKSPFSGLFSDGCESHFGPPTAPKSTLSDFLQISTVSCGSGTPYLSMAQPPIYTS